MSSHCNICSEKCFGIEKNHGSCCSVENRDYIIGPHNDCDNFIENLSKKIGRKVKYLDIFIDHAEGSKLFPEKKYWQDPKNYPALRVDLNNPKKPCIFYNTVLKCCMVYEIRPNICRDFECNYLKNNK